MKVDNLLKNQMLNKHLSKNKEKCRLKENSVHEFQTKNLSLYKIYLD